MQLADHITCRVLGVDDVIWAVEPWSEAGVRLARTPECYGVSDHREWLERRRLQEQVDAWWTSEVRDAHGPALGQLPTLDRPLRVLESGGVLDDVGLFELKRFLFYATQLVRAGAAHVALLDASWAELLAAMMNAVHPEKQPTPRFRLSAALDERLASSRKTLKQARKVEQDCRHALESEIVASLGGAFDVRGRYKAAAPVTDARLRVATDGKYDLVDEALDAATDGVEEAVAAVQTVEAEVRANLSKQLAPQAEALDTIRQALAELDVLVALSELRATWDGCWPTWGSRTSISLGRHPWLLDLDDAQPISVTLGNRPVVVTGPNMGGKSMLLKLIGLSQWCGQHGFPFPAQAVEFAPTDQLVYVGADADDEGYTGLSSFGREVRRVVQHTDASRPTMWLLDELARGTHPEEGAQIAQDFVQARANAGDAVVAATHFPSLAHWEGADHFQIAGLTDPSALDALGDVSSLDEIEAALRAAMDYAPIARDAADSGVPRDARRVAEALGLSFDQS